MKSPSAPPPEPTDDDTRVDRAVARAACKILARIGKSGAAPEDRPILVELLAAHGKQGDYASVVKRLDQVCKDVEDLKAGRTVARAFRPNG